MNELYYIANYRLPTERAHGLQVAKMCEAFAREGVRVTVLAPRRGQSKTSLFGFYGIEENFVVRYLPVWDLTGKIPFLGFFVQSMTFAAQVLTAVHRERYRGIIYGRDQFSLFVLSVFTQNRLVYEMHSMPKRILFWHRIFFAKLHRFVVISGGLAAALTRAGIAQNKIVVAHDGYDPDESPRISGHEARVQFKLPADRRVVLYCGSLMKWKGVYTLVDAAKLLSSTFLTVLVGGPPHEYGSLTAYAGTHDAPGLRILKQVSHREAQRLMVAADVLVIPNSGAEPISRLYTSPLKFFEYLASGKPIVASDLPSLREIGGHYDGVFYCAADDPHALAKTISEVPEHRSYKRDLSQFSWRSRAQRIRAALAESGQILSRQ